MRLLIIVLHLLLISSVSLFAAPVEIPKTGQVVSYRAGDDGGVQAGTEIGPQRQGILGTARGG